MTGKKEIEINENTQATLINIQRSIIEAQARMQAVASAYLDAHGEGPEGWQLKQDFSAFEYVGQPEEDAS